jgi:taspase (threonine aspartase 1)
MPRRPQQGGDLCAIFVHGGAGYHSEQNERAHLATLSDAAKVAMAILKNGGDATDAVEMAIRHLEDKEITNAGYGSNLTVDGAVECDATIVDHLGRSGAVAAIAQVKNPIAVARLVLDEAIKPLSLLRIPPNLLVGAGATDYAADRGIPIMPPDFLVSMIARQRWLRWRQDLEDVRMKEAQQEAQGQAWGTASTGSGPSCSPISPSPSPSTSSSRPGLSNLPPLARPLVESTADVPTLSRTGATRNTPPAPRTAAPPSATPAQDKMSGYESSEQSEAATDDNFQRLMSPSKRQKVDGSFDGATGDDNDSKPRSSSHSRTGPARNHGRDDEITDTVGAIAVDCFGRIAAGSSSGGIGMKHRGRCGPAALVGIGTSVLPIDAQDPTQTCVATVTSGTGEHLAITTAAATAADRMYYSVRKENGRLVPCSEDESLHSMIWHDFMKHPGVKDSHCAPAIGLLAVKKSRDGIYLYFGHNTESFALASMHSEERSPVCTMSRKGHGHIVQGGRLSRAKYARGR